MSSYYWKSKSGKWYWRESKQSNDFHGPYKNKAAAKEHRARYYKNIAKKMVVLSL